jgi:predicted transglutaminase-like protease
MTQDLYTTKRSLELEWQQEHLKEGNYNINMSYIDKKIQEVIKEIIAKEFEESTRLNKVDESKAQVSIAT